MVTGPVVSGTVRVGETVLPPPSGLRARIRGIHLANRPVQSAAEGERGAPNLIGAGVRKDAVRRSDRAVDLARAAASQRRDVALHGCLGSAPLGGGQGRRPHAGQLAAVCAGPRATEAGTGRGAWADRRGGTSMHGGGCMVAGAWQRGTAVGKGSWRATPDDDEQSVYAIALRQSRLSKKRRSAYRACHDAFRSSAGSGSVRAARSKAVSSITASSGSIAGRWPLKFAGVDVAYSPFFREPGLVREALAPRGTTRACRPRNLDPAPTRDVRAGSTSGHSRREPAVVEVVDGLADFRLAVHHERVRSRRSVRRSARRSARGSWRRHRRGSRRRPLALQQSHLGFPRVFACH